MEIMIYNHLGAGTEARAGDAMNVMSDVASEMPVLGFCLNLNCKPAQSGGSTFLQCRRWGNVFPASRV